MLIINTQKNALLCNKDKYMKSMCIPLFSAMFFSVLTVSPYLISLLFNRLRFFIPERYIVYNSVLKCIIILAIGFLAYLFYCTLSLGEEAWYSGRLTYKKNCFKRFIYWFRPSKAIKALSLKFTLLSLKLFWTIIFLLPATVTASVIFLTAFNGGIEVYLFLSLLGGTLVLLICGLLFRFIFIQRYFLSEFILSQNPNLGIIQIIRQSKNLLDGHIFKVVSFKLSFVPIFLSCILIIPLFFVYPHYKQSRTIIANELMI